MAGGRLMFAITAAPPGIGVGRRCRNLWNMLVVGLAPVHHALPQPLRAGMRVGALREADAVRRACASIGFGRLVLPTRESRRPWALAAGRRCLGACLGGYGRVSVFSFEARGCAKARKPMDWAKRGIIGGAREARRPDNPAFSLASMAARAVFASLSMPARAYAPASGQSPPCPWAAASARARSRAGKKKATPRHVPWGRARLAVRRKKKLPRRNLSFRGAVWGRPREPTWPRRGGSRCPCRRCRSCRG